MIMASNNNEYIDTFSQKCDTLYNNLESIQFQKVVEVMRKRPTFEKYSQELKDQKNSKDFESFLKRTINKQTILNEFNHILLHTGHEDIVKQIDKSLKDLCDFDQCDPKLSYQLKFSFGEENPKDILEIHESSSSNSTGFYPMCDSPRGLCVLINNYFTIGTYKEMQRFRNIFYQLHFDAIMRKNLQYSDIEALLKKLSKNPELSQHNAFVFMILTSDYEKKQINDSVNQSLDIVKLIKMLDDSIGSYLKGKPKLIFFNCSCESTFAKKTDSFSVSDDWFICHSILEKSIDWENGTDFGRTMADVLRNRASYKDIDEIMKKTNSLIKKTFKEYKLLKCNTLSNSLFFNPWFPKQRKYFLQKTLQALMNDKSLKIDDKQLIELIEQLCKKLKHMHDKGIFHSNINPENIKISFQDGNEKKELNVEDIENTEIQADKNSKSGQSKTGYLCWKAPEVFDVLNDHQDFEWTKENDIFSLGCVIYFVISRGSHPFGRNFDNIVHYKPELEDLKDHKYMICTDLIQAMISLDKIKRPSIACVLNHPMFWTSDMIKTFFVEISPQLQSGIPAKGSVSLTKDKLDQVKIELNLKKDDVFGTDWLPQLGQKVYEFEDNRIKDKNKFHVKDSKSTISLIKYVRDKVSHPEDWPLESKSSNNIIDYLMEQFPLLLIYTYNAFEKVKSV